MRYLHPLVSLILFFCSFYSVKAQMTVVSQITANQAVSNIVGPGITFSNPQFFGDPLFIGSFTNGNTTPIGLSSGIVLATGPVDSVVAPSVNFMSYTSGAGLGLLDIPEIVQLTGVDTTFDGSILEFDFIPLSNSINVQYVFASEEYNEFINSPYNDAFGFFISGPGIVGAPNIATVPFTGLPVTINTVNNGLSVNGYGIDPITLIPNDGCGDGTCTNCAYYIDNCLGSNIVFDGNTTILTASATVIPCSTYHIKLIIADVSDAAWDCAVFLGTDGFAAQNYQGISPTINYAIASSTTAYEDCATNNFIFSIANPSPNPTVINYTIAGTATSGTDYPAIPTSVTIPAGQTTASVPITFLPDGITEGTETVLLIYQSSICGTDTVIMNVTDYPGLSVDAGNTSVICSGGNPVVLSASSSGGVGTVSFSWNNGAGNGQNVQVNPAVNTTYVVTGTDACGQSATDSVTVNVTGGVSSTFTVTSPVCTGQNSTVTYTGSGQPTSTYVWNFGGATIVSGSGQGPYSINWNTAGNPQVSLYVVENGCTSSTTTQNVVVNTGPTATFNVVSPICAGDNTTVTYTGSGTAAANYSWNFGTATVVSGTGQGPYTLNWNTAGNYSIGLSVSENGCNSSPQIVNVVVNPIPTATIIAPGGQCLTGNSFNFAAGAPGPGTTFSWTFTGANTTTSSQQNPSGISWPAAGTYPVGLTVTQNGCVSAPATTNISVYDIPQVAFNGGPLSGCAPLTVNFSSIFNNGITNYSWSFAGTAGGNTPNPVFTFGTTGSFGVALTVTDTNGCSNTQQINNYVNVYPEPVAGFVAKPEIITLDKPWVEVSDGSTDAVSWIYTVGSSYSTTSSSFSYNFTEEGIYTITQVITNQYGCRDSAALSVVVKPVTEVFIPNTFTPNGDPYNDDWKVILTYIQGFDLWIFDRWGEVIFYSDDVFYRWNGRYKNSGAIVKQDMYVYKIKYIDSLGKEKQLIGHVNVIR